MTHVQLEGRRRRALAGLPLQPALPMRYPNDLDHPVADHPSKAEHQLREGDAETFGQLLCGREPAVQVAALDLLVVRQRHVEVPDLTTEQIRAVFRYAAWLASQQSLCAS